MNSSINDIHDHSSVNQTNKKSLKLGLTLSEEVCRRQREDNAIRIRKDKRYDLANIRRHKSDTTTFNEITIEETLFKRKEESIRNLESLKIKTNQIYSDNINDQLDATEYFRKILSLDKNPPINVIVETGIIPRLIYLISQYHNDKVAFEATWCITNISCGESIHIDLLINNNVLPSLLTTLYNTNNTSLKEQCLWAISNLITEESGVCREYLLQSNILELLLNNLDIPSQNNYKTSSPALSTMRYTTWTLCSLCKGNPLLTVSMQESIIYAFTELLYSPDIGIIPEVCVALCLLLEQRIENIQYSLEQGILTRLKEICENTSLTISIYCYAIRPLCIICRSTYSLHRKVVLSSLSCSNMSCIYLFLYHLNQYIHMINDGKDIPSYKNGPVVGTLTSSFTSIISTSKSINSVNTLSVSCIEICKTLEILIVSNSIYIYDIIMNNGINVLILAVELGSYDISFNSAYCLCRLSLLYSKQLDSDIIYKIILTIYKLLKSTDNQLVNLILHSYLHLITNTSINTKVFQDTNISDCILWLCNHPVSEVSILSCELYDKISEFNNSDA